MYSKRKLLLGFWITGFLLCAASQDQATAADITTLFSGAYPQFFGKQAAMIAPSNSTACNTMDANGGWLTMTNAIFCHLKNSGITGPGTYTWGPIGANTLHLIISKGGTGLDVTGAPTSYDFQIDIWVCASPANCAVTVNYTRMVSLNYSYVDDGTGLNGTVNKGELMLDASVFDGLTGGNYDVTYIVYDLGTSSASQKVIVKKVGSGTGYTFGMRGDISRTDINHINFALALNTSVGTTPAPPFRFTGSLDRTNNTGVGFAEQSGLGGLGTTATVNTTANGDAPIGCYAVTRSPSGSDWSYAIGIAASCGTLVNAADSLTTISNYTPSGLVGSWNGMSATPPAF